MPTSIRPLSLDSLTNNVGITSPENLESGRFNVWRNSLPASELPLGRRLVADGVPFDFPNAGPGRSDNVRCEGQFLELPQGHYDWLHLLGAAERRVEDWLAFHFSNGTVDFELLRISDFWAAEPAFGEFLAIATCAMHYPHHVQPNVSGMLWCQRVPVTRRAELHAVRLPDNVAVHIFAATLQGAHEWAAPEPRALWSG